MTIPLDVLVSAADALRAAKDSPGVGTLPMDTWRACMVASNLLDKALEPILRAQKVEVAA